MIQTHQINSGDKITIEPGCYIRTMDHMISADESKTIEIQKKTMDWTGELAELFGRANTEGIHVAIQVQRRIRRERVVQGTRPDQASRGQLNLHIASCHDWH